MASYPPIPELPRIEFGDGGEGSLTMAEVFQFSAENSAIAKGQGLVQMFPDSQFHPEGDR